LCAWRSGFLDLLFALNEFEDSVHAKAHKLTDEHAGTLEERVVPRDSVNLGIILNLHDNGVERAEEQHAKHDAIESDPCYLLSLLRHN